MFKLSRMDNMLSPFKRMCVLGIGSDEGVNSLTKVSVRSGTQPFQSLPPQYAKPAFHLVEPRGMGRRVMEMDKGMLYQPPVVLWLVGLQVVHDNVKFLLRVLGDYLVHEIQKLPAAAAQIMADMYHAGSYLQSSKQGSSTMPLILMAKPAQGLPIRQAEPSLRPLKRLNSRLLVHTNNHGVLWRVHVKLTN